MQHPGHDTAETTPETGLPADAPGSAVAGAPDTAREEKRSEALAVGHRSARRREKVRRFVLQAGVLVTVLALWWLITAMEWVKPLFLPAPDKVWNAFVQANQCRPISEGASRVVCGEQGYYLWEHLLASLKRMGVGVGAAVLIGPILGFLMGSVRWLRDAVDPYLNFLRSLPPLGYIGLLIVWFGIGDASKHLLLFLAAFPPITIATINGIKSIRGDRLHAAQSLGANRAQLTTQVVLPSVLPELINGIRIATGFAWTTVVAAELNNGLPGIGGLAYDAGKLLNTPLTIACIIVIGLAAVALDALIATIGRILVPWQGKV